jgi:uncharacterized phage-like protein YoqJ
MELTAALEATRASSGPLEVRSDSTYVVNCFRDRWWESWIRRGWVNSKKQPIANRDLWQPLIELVLERGDVRFIWVKGHSDDPMNDLVDRLAVEAAVTQQARSGEEPPTELGPPDRIASAAPTRRDNRLPGGWLVVVGGHRPTELGGYDANPTAASVGTRMGEALRGLRSLHPDLVVLSGLQLGAELLGAEAAAAEGIPLVAVLPYPEPDKLWPTRTRARFAELVGRAARVVTLDDRQPRSRQAAGMALARRDAWLARQADGAVLVWDGEDDNVGRLVRTFEDHLGDEGFVLVAP